jgi:glycosyltransferase involved in cell wall biosynthesis
MSAAYAGNFRKHYSVAGGSMKILYDHQIFSWQKFGGISRYFYELMKHSEGLFDYEISGLFSENDYVRPLQVYHEFPVKCCFRGKQRIINYLNKADSLKKIKKGSYDVLHPTYYDPYFPKKKPLVITVYDMIHELFPEYFPRDKKTVYIKEVMISRADKIIAISENTKNDILKCYPKTDEGKIYITYLGTSYKVLNNQEKENYILFTGQRFGYKNYKSFLIAAAPLLLKYNINLVCTGKGFDNNEKKMIDELHIAEKTICKFVSDEELIDLYARAIAFVFPSLYEGFGIPVLEAFAAGCPAILANTGSLPEIGGNAALYFDPYSVEDMRSVIEKVITSPGLQNELINRGKEQIKKYSWKKCAEKTAEIYMMPEK